MTSQAIAIHEQHSLMVATLKYILNQTIKKLPVKSSEIVKHCLRGESKNLDRILPTVTDKLLDIYGLQTHHIRDEKQGKIYLFTSTVSAGSDLCYTERQAAELRLLFIVLSLIYMKSVPVLDTTLYAFLKRFNIEDEDHGYFGDYKKLINVTFVKQMYLKREVENLGAVNTDDRVQFSWSHRAELEFSKQDVLEAVANIFEKPSKVFQKQYIEVYGADDHEENPDEEMDDS